MKKKAIVIILLWLGFGSAFSQEISKEIIGKWKLTEVGMMGQKGSPLEVFGVAEAYQEYTKPNKFTGFLGEKVTGKFKIDKAAKKIEIDVNNESTIFEIKTFSTKNMVLNLKAEEGIITLYYEKVTK